MVSEAGRLMQEGWTPVPGGRELGIPFFSPSQSSIPQVLGTLEKFLLCVGDRHTNDHKATCTQWGLCVNIGYF